MTSRKRRQPSRRLLGPSDLAEATSLVALRAESEKVRVALVGGAAMQFYGSPRLTVDVDFVAAAPIRETQNIRPTGNLSFGGRKYLVLRDIPADLIVREDEYAELYQEALDTAELTEEGFWVVTPEYLAAMKFGARRAKDTLDLLWLLAQPNLVDISKLEGIVKQHLGGRFGLDEFHSLLREAKWRAEAGEFEE